MRFRRAVQRYGKTPQPVTPYQRAAQAWDERIGSARVQARNWRLAAFGALGLSAVLAAGLTWQSAQSRVVPYVVEVDRLGEARSVSPAIRDYRPTDAQAAWHLARFIANVRSISIDPVLMRRDWLSAYDFASGRAASFLSEYAREAAPFELAGTISVSVDVTSVVRASDRSFQVEWIERRYERGSLAASSRWTAILAVAMKPPADAEQLRRNPLGLFVEHIAWSKQFESADGPRPGSAQALPATQPAHSSPPIPSPGVKP